MAAAQGPPAHPDRAMDNFSDSTGPPTQSWDTTSRPSRRPTLRPLAPAEYIGLMSASVLSRDPEVMGGTAVFPSTRVPVQTLLDYLEAGETIDDFLEGFPTVKREQVIAFLEAATERLVAATP